MFQYRDMTGMKKNYILATVLPTKKIVRVLLSLIDSTFIWSGHIEMPESGQFKSKPRDCALIQKDTRGLHM